MPDVPGEFLLYPDGAKIAKMHTPAEKQIAEREGTHVLPE
jgi:hypothetical protein